MQLKHAPNRLAQETSPYLLMHAHNPVDWYPWSEEAFAKARRENKVVFLSIGYSSCYWCHVMERESFVDEEIAKFLNEHFVCIKVDREERPDVDDIYMTASLILPPHRGGWPLSAFLTPEAKPFHVGTYFPARTGDRPGGMPGFLHVIRQVSGAWQQDEERIRLGGEQVADRLKEVLREQAPTDLAAVDRTALDKAQAALAEQFDPEYGGFGYSPDNPHLPKFPSPPNLMLLIEQARDEKNVAARKMLLTTLEQMAQGGIRDHVGGGFHRYSTDRRWKIPHFEKMLYDNGQLATVYAEAFALTGRQDFRRALVELLDFVLREMTDEAGAFYSALDAETDTEEGKFYRWEKEELETLLDEDAMKLVGQVYGLHGEPNFEGEYYVPLLAKPLADLASDLDLDEQALDQQLVPIRQKLLAARNERKRPFTDTKVLTAWNGLMIRGFADAGRILKEPKYTQAAARAAEFLLAHLQTDDGRLLRSYREGEAKLNAYLDDYTFLVDGLLALDRATDDPRWREAADRLTQKQIKLFWDDDGGGFYFTSDDHETLIARAKKRTDSVLPSGNAVAVRNLLTLGSVLKKPSYIDHAEKTLAALGNGLQDDRTAGAMPGLAVALARWLELESQK